MNGVKAYTVDGARDIGEINGGVVGMITPEVAFRADAGIQLGEHGYHNTSAMLSGNIVSDVSVMTPTY